MFWDILGNKGYEGSSEIITDHNGIVVRDFPKPLGECLAIKVEILAPSSKGS